MIKLAVGNILFAKLLSRWPVHLLINKPSTNQVATYWGLNEPPTQTFCESLVHIPIKACTLYEVIYMKLRNVNVIEDILHSINCVTTLTFICDLLKVAFRLILHTTNFSNLFRNGIELTYEFRMNKTTFQLWMIYTLKL